ncbi:hypothetical protein BY457_109145 [Marinilabilia salmonicolor]|uniref:hypothetical protein n=1 Tax=Marinilabilia salmonicolor TaxID=989 RepID=UPI000D059C82|nr:hypothetical protein [Marinilabilia salmonicolor]PRY98876.1 hypothetical protein BY457_109145 [Marinilabilia salmonicolor]
MKRFMYLLVFSVYMAFMAASCATGSQKSDDHGHEHGTETHEHDHAQEHVTQEEFVVDDSTNTSGTEEHHDHEHNDHVHEH